MRRLINKYTEDRLRERERERERAATSEHWIQREREVRLGKVRLSRLGGRALRLGRERERKKKKASK